MKFLYLFFFSLNICFFIYPQENIPLGTWRTHLTYHNAKRIIQVNNLIYCASENGLFTLDLSDNGLEIITKANGLSDIEITDLSYHNRLKTLIITYKNGNIDLIKPQEIINIRSILNARIVNKQINSILIDGLFAYLCGNFGLAKLDIANEQIKETYINIGTQGSLISVSKAAILNDSLFLASDMGLMKASLNLNVNLLDFANWELINNSPINHLTSLKENLFFTINEDSLYQYNSKGIVGINIAPNRFYRNLESHQDNILLSTADTIYVINSDLSYETISGVKLPNDIIYQNSQNIWVADQALGLLRITNNKTESYFPSGPYDRVFKLLYFQNKLLALSGGYNYNPLQLKYIADNNYSGFYIFENGKWTNYTSENNEIETINIPALSDLSVAAYSNNTVYMGSFQDGLLVWNTDDNTFDSLKNTPLVHTNEGKLHITGLATDSKGHLWISNYGVSQGKNTIHNFQPSTNTWISFAFDDLIDPLDIVIDHFDYKWIRLSPESGRGVFIFDDEGRKRKLSKKDGEGALPDDRVYSIAIDKENTAWLGTGSGLVTFFDANSLLDGEFVNGTLPFFDGRPLLNDEKITAIAIDGGNRKWIGSQHGVWLFNEDGTEQIAYFNERNSPLLSDLIIDIAINNRSGEVFFATDKGIISYRGTATIGDNTYKNIKVFPNPVHPNFDGLVNISGLIENSEVKITDISGRLIREIFSEGGTAVWNVKNYNGEKAKTGIYLIFMGTPDGDMNFVSKIAVIE